MLLVTIIVFTLECIVRRTALGVIQDLLVSMIPVHEIDTRNPMSLIDQRLAGYARLMTINQMGFVSVLTGDCHTIPLRFANWVIK